jgi:hypothetical protein
VSSSDGHLATDDTVLEALRALDEIEHLSKVARQDWHRRFDGDGHVRALGQVIE